MTVAAAVLLPSRAGGGGLGEAVAAALGSGADETLAVVGSAGAAAAVPEGATVLLDDAKSPDEASAARVALDWVARAGHATVVVAYGDLRRSPAVRHRGAWSCLVEATPRSPVLVGTRRGHPAGLVRLEAASWSLLPLSGTLAVLWQTRPELAAELDLSDLPR